MQTSRYGWFAALFCMPHFVRQRLTAYPPLLYGSPPWGGRGERLVLLGMGRPTKVEQEQKRRELSEKQMAFAVWHAAAPAEREPKSEADLCEVLGVSRQSAWRWRQDPKVVEAIRYLSLQRAGSPDKVARMLDMLFDLSIESRSVRGAEAWLKATGVMSQFQRSSSLLETVEAEAGEFTDFSLAELEALRAQVEADGEESLAIAKAKALLKPVVSE